MPSNLALGSTFSDQQCVDRREVGSELALRSTREASRIFDLTRGVDRSVSGRGGKLGEVEPVSRRRVLGRTASEVGRFGFGLASEGCSRPSLPAIWRPSESPRAVAMADHRPEIEGRWPRPFRDPGIEDRGIGRQAPVKLEGQSPRPIPETRMPSGPGESSVVEGPGTASRSNSPLDRSSRPRASPSR